MCKPRSHVKRLVASTAAELLLVAKAKQQLEKDRAHRAPVQPQAQVVFRHSLLVIRSEDIATRLEAISLT